MNKYTEHREWDRQVMPNCEETLQVQSTVHYRVLLWDKQNKARNMKARSPGCRQKSSHKVRVNISSRGMGRKVMSVSKMVPKVKHVNGHAEDNLPTDRTVYNHRGEVAVRIRCLIGWHKTGVRVCFCAHVRVCVCAGANVQDHLVG